jgi:hypothetical protein
LQKPEFAATETILMIPLQNQEQNLIGVPIPEHKHADLYLLEIPPIEFINKTRGGIVYIPDPYSATNITIMLP